MNKLGERVADSIRELGIRGAIFFAISLAFIAMGAWRFSLNPGRYGLRNYEAWGGWLLFCLAALFVGDYVLHHAPIVFIIFSVLWLALSFVEPHLAMVSGVVLLCVLGAAVISAFMAFTKNDLIRAIERGQVEKALSLIRAGVDLNAQEGGRMALHESVRKGAVDIVRALLAAHADADAKDASGVTPLMAAAKSKNPELARLLIDGGANVNTRDPGGETPLMRAAISGNAEICQALIRARADINARSSGDYSALKWATVMRKGEVAAILRGAGAVEEPVKS
jgi:Ankyrin repeats (3 copies)/Ankyrin repeat